MKKIPKYHDFLEKKSPDFCQFFWFNIKVGSLFASDNSEPKVIFCQIFWCNLKVGSLFGSNNSKPKVIFLHFSSKFKNLKIGSK